MIFPANPLQSLLGYELIVSFRSAKVASMIAAFAERKATMLVFAFSLVVYFALCSLTWAQEAPIRFGSDVRPVLSNYCFRCHGPDDAHREADLRLDTLEGATTPIGDQQPIVPGNASTSYILERMRTTDVSLRMPPIDSGLELTESQIATIEQWIDQGAKYEGHWAFDPISSPAIPIIDSEQGSNPIDAFVLSRLKTLGIQPSRTAERSTLLRRVYLDLLGVLPEPEQIADFVDDNAPDAYERVVDELLASPRYGERWGRHWLDQARYADTNGYTVDADRSIWPYRDWVIASINADMPFDQFTIEQLAGDLLDSPSISQQIASGFHRNTLVNQEGGSDAEQFRNEAVVDRVNTTGAVWLGLTLGCAQCHNHKYDPISQKEFYQLFAFFNDGQDVNSVEPILRLPTPEQATHLEKLDQDLAVKRMELEQTKGLATASTDETKKEIDALQNSVKELEKARNGLLAKIPSTMVMKDLDEPRPAFVHVRGDFLRHGDSVVPATPAVLPPMNPRSDRADRLDLARWLVDPSHPLTPRVVVNRVWTHFFSLGIVETENDFGIQGSPASHPELLDWLARDLIDHGWSIKRLHRWIVLSSTYQQSSEARSDLESIDPRNRWLARQQRLRVDAEIVRDLTLAASGLLSSHIGGPSVYPPQQEGIYSFTQNAGAWPTSQGDDRYRRTMYTFFRRAAPYPLLTAFDTPRLDTTCTRRVRSNTPLQSLTLANDPMFLEIAGHFGQRILSISSDDGQRVEWAFQRCLGRSPQDVEKQRLIDYVNALRSRSMAEPQIWQQVARVLFNLDEFITRE